MKPILLDTGCIVALLDRSERHHRKCAELVMQLDDPLVTCEAVIAESCYLLRAIRGAADSVLENVEQGVFQVPFRLADATKEVRVQLRRYASVPIDFADACLVCLANELRTGRILTLDRDFEVYRWQKTKPFEMLVDLE